MASEKRIFIVGSAPGTIGHWLAAKVFAPLPDAAVTLVDLPERMDALGRAARKMSGRVDVRVADYSREPAVEGIEEADVVGICVPGAAVEQTAQALVPKLKSGAMVFDAVSEKAEPLRLIEKYASEDVSVIGTHPLFGPKVDEPAGQVVVICPVRVVDQGHVKWMKEVFERAGLRVAEMSAEAHDEAMLAVQVLTHFTLLVFAQALGQLRRRLEKWRELGDDALWQCATPPFAALLSFACRMLDSPLRTYAQIQKLAGADEVRKIFAEAAAELASEIGEERRVEEIAEVFARAGDEFVRRALEYGSALSAVQVEAVQENFAELARARREKSLCVVAVRDGAEVKYHAGVVEEIGPRFVLLRERCASVPVVEDEGQVRVVGKGEKATGQRILIAYDEASMQACRRRGIRPREQVIKVHHRRAVVLRPEQVRQWRAENLLPWYRDVVVRLGETAAGWDKAGEAAAMVVRHAHADIVDARVVRAGKAPDGRQEIIVRMEIFGDRLPEPAVRAAQELIRALGLE